MLKYAVIAIFTLLLAAIGWLWVQNSGLRIEVANKQSEIDRLNRDRAQAIARAVQDARAQDAETIRRQAANLAEQTTRLEEVSADAVRADAASERLQRESAANRARARRCESANQAAAATPAPAASSPGDLQAFVQRRLDEAAGIIGRYADQAAVAAAGCAADYDALPTQ